MMWQVFLVAAAVISSSDGCSRLCPCHREIDNITQRLDSLGELEGGFISELMGTLKRVSKNVDQLIKASADNKHMSDALTELTARVEDMAFEIQDGEEESNCTEEGVITEDTDEILDSPKQCPSGWNAFGGSCYYFQQSRLMLSQEQANIQCSKTYNGSSLVAIESRQEFNFLKQNLTSIYRSISGRTENGWLTSAKRINGQLKWETTGAPFDENVINWGRGQPDGGTQACVSFWPAYSFDLADVMCSAFSRQFICEI